MTHVFHRALQFWAEPARDSYFTRNWLWCNLYQNKEINSNLHNRDRKTMRRYFLIGQSIKSILHTYWSIPYIQTSRKKSLMVYYMCKGWKAKYLSSAIDLHNTCCMYHHVCMCVRKETFPGRRKSIQAGHKHGHSSRSSLQSSSYRRHTTSPPWSLSYKWSHLIFATTIQPAVMFLFRACVPHIDDDDFIISLHVFCFFRVLWLLWYYICTVSGGLLS